MTSDRELMQQALEALELLAKYENPATKVQVRKPRDGGPIVTMYPHKVATDAAAPLRERLAQPEQEQEPVAHSIVAGALFDFMGWLTTRRERLVLSSSDDAAPAADAIKDFAQMRSLSINDAQVQEWQKHLATPPRREWVGLTEEEIEQVCVPLGAAMLSFPEVARAIEAKLKEKNGRVDSFLRRLLDPEDLGHAVSHEVRQKVRELL